MIVLSFTRAYPWQSLLMVSAMLLAGVVEGFGLSALLPLISFAVDAQAGTDPENQSELAQMVVSVGPYPLTIVAVFRSRSTSLKESASPPLSTSRTPGSGSASATTGLLR